MARMQAVYYRQDDGIEPVDLFIDTLPTPHQVRIEAQIELLNQLEDRDPPLPFPHSSQVRDALRELRCHYGPVLYRVLSQRSGTLVVLLHTIRKDRGSLLEADIQIAQQRWENFTARMNAMPRRPPRAAGHDAP